MSTDESAEQEEEFPLWLAACDDALAADDPAATVLEGAVPPEMRPRLEREVAWCQMVRQLLLRADPTALTSPEAGQSGAVLAKPSPEPLTQLGRFQLRRQLGRGSFGVVYLAYDPQLRREVALKVPRPEALVNPELRVRFQHEARAAAGLDHPNLVSVYEVGEEGAVSYLVSAYCPGITLAAWLKQTTEPVPYRQAAELTATLADAVEHAHQRGVLHRDLKPSNILLQTNPTTDYPVGARSPDRAPAQGHGQETVPQQGEDFSSVLSEPSVVSFLPKIADFGLAKLLDGAASAGAYQTQSGAILGTPNYMPPEQAGGQSKRIGPASDVYGLGAILYELLTRRPPFQADTMVDTLLLVRTQEPLPPGRLRPKVPRDLETICLKCLQKEPRQRYASAQALAEDLRRYWRGEPIQARRVGLLGRLLRWCRRKPALASTLAFAVVVTLVVAGVGFWRVGQEQLKVAAEQKNVLAERDRYRTEREKAITHLYHSLTGEAPAIRLARGNGYRAVVWSRLEQAMQLDTAERDPLSLRHEAVACMGDFVGFEPRVWTDLLPPLYAVALALAPHNREVALGLTDGSVSLRDIGTGVESARLRGHRSGVFDIAYGPRGDLLVSADDVGVIKVWSRNSTGAWACTRTLTTAPSGQPNYVHAVSLALTANGKSLLACPRTATGVYSWDLTIPTPASYYLGPNHERLGRAVLSPDGRRLACDYRHNDVHGVLLWDTASRKVLRQVTLELGPVSDLAFSGDGKHLACACADGVALYDTSELRARLFARGDGPDSIAFSPDGQLLAIPVPRQGVVRLWNVTTNREVAVLTHPHEPHSVAFSADGSTLVAVAASSVRVWNLRGNGEKQVLSGHAAGVNSLVFSPDGKLLASTGSDRTVRVWDAITSDLVRQLSGFRAPVQSAAFTPDGHLLATADHSGAVRLWEFTATGAPTEHTLPQQAIGQVLWSVRFSPDGTYLAAAGEDGLALWKATPATANRGTGPRQDYTPCNRLPIRNGVTGLCFRPDSKGLAWVQHNTTLHLWRLDTAEVTHLPSAHPVGPGGIAYFPDGKHMALVGLNEGEAQVWDLAAGQKAFSWNLAGCRHPDGYTTGHAVALTGDGTWLAVQGSSVTVWDTHSRELVLALPKERSNCASMAWSPDGMRLAIGSADGNLVIWNLPKVRAQLATIGLAW
jgi:WD40 repeat protein/serine/threonine protein kinase